MPKPPKMLYVLFEGLPATVIESQVLLHAKDMRERGIADFEILAFTGSPGHYRKSQTRRARAQELSQSKVSVFPCLSLSLPFSLIINAILLWLVIAWRCPRFSAIHARGSYAAAVCAHLRLIRGFTLIWDHRGDPLAEFDAGFAPASPLLRLAKRYKMAAIRRWLTVAARGCSKANFVSRPLFRTVSAQLGSKPYEIIPCTAPGEIFFFDPGLREKTREALGFRPGQAVYVYSGSLASYQCFSETVAAFGRILRDAPDSRLLVLTPETEAAAGLLRELPRDSFVLRRARFEEVNAYLNAADFAFMLRKPSPVNLVASPTKFAEYCLTGLTVIMTDAVEDSFNLAGQAGNLRILERGRLFPAPSVDRPGIARQYAGLLSRETHIDGFRRLYLGDDAGKRGGTQD